MAQLEKLEFGYIMICASTDELISGCPGAVIRDCGHCQTKVWYNPMGDESYGQGLAKFECINCAAERYQAEDDLRPLAMSEATRRHLRSLGISDQRIENSLFLMTVELLGRKRRR